jgi:hypothetical protein
MVVTKISLDRQPAEYIASRLIEKKPSAVEVLLIGSPLVILQKPTPAFAVQEPSLLIFDWRTPFSQID